MKKLFSEFFRRGVMSAGIGPVVLAALYLILSHQGKIEALTAKEVAAGIFSLTALAFVAGGMNVIYQLERLPLMAAILIHGIVLYISYLVTYLINDWLEWGLVPLLAFSGVFVVGYLLIWIIIYSVIRRKTERLNEILKEKQRATLHKDFKP